MNINYDQSSFEVNENKNNEKENNISEENENESNEESDEEENEESNENEDSNNYETNQILKELNETRKLYKQVQTTLANIKEALKKFFINLTIPEKENEIKNILKLSGCKENEIMKIIHRK